MCVGWSPAKALHRMLDIRHALETQRRLRDSHICRPVQAHAPSNASGRLRRPVLMPALRPSQTARASSDDNSGHRSPASTAACSAGGSADAEPSGTASSSSRTASDACTTTISDDKEITDKAEIQSNWCYCRPNQCSSAVFVVEK